MKNKMRRDTLLGGGGALYETLKKMVNFLYFIVQKQKKTGKFWLKCLDISLRLKKKFYE